MEAPRLKSPKQCILLDNENRCEELCSAFQWCLGYSFYDKKFGPGTRYNSYCYMYTLSGGCGRGTNMGSDNRYKPIAKTIADMIADTRYPNWNCIVKTSGKILFVIFSQ